MNMHIPLILSLRLLRKSKKFHVCDISANWLDSINLIKISRGYFHYSLLVVFIFLEHLEEDDVHPW